MRFVYFPECATPKNFSLGVYDIVLFEFDDTLLLLAYIDGDVRPLPFYWKFFSVLLISRRTNTAHFIIYFNF